MSFSDDIMLHLSTLDFTKHFLISQIPKRRQFLACFKSSLCPGSHILWVEIQNGGIIKALPMENTIRYAIFISEFDDHGILSNHFIMFPIYNCM